MEYRTTENYDDTRKYQRDRDMYVVRDKRNYHEDTGSYARAKCRNCDEEIVYTEQYERPSTYDRYEPQGSRVIVNDRYGRDREELDYVDPLIESDRRSSPSPYYFGDQRSGSSIRRSHSGKKKWTPVCDMGETEKYWLIRCEVPGVRKDKLKVEIEGKDLIIKGKRLKELWNVEKLGIPSVETTKEEKKAEAETQSGSSTAPDSSAPAPSGTASAQKDNASRSVSWMDKERGGRGTYKRKIRLPQRVEQSAIQALYKDGILEILIKKPDIVEYKKKSSNKLIAIH